MKRLKRKFEDFTIDFSLHAGRGGGIPLRCSAIVHEVWVVCFKKINLETVISQNIKQITLIRGFVTSENITGSNFKWKFSSHLHQEVFQQDYFKKSWEGVGHESNNEKLHGS